MQPYGAIEVQCLQLYARGTRARAPKATTPSARLSVGGDVSISIRGLFPIVHYLVSQRPTS